MSVFDAAEFKQRFIDKIATRYRESPVFLAILDAVLEEVAELEQVLCDLEDCLVLTPTTSGACLDIIGRSVGLDREQCNAQDRQFFGFEGNPLALPYDEGLYFDSGEPLSESFTFDDAQYRDFIAAHLVRNQSRATPPEILEVARLLWGPDVAIYAYENFETVIWVQRDLTIDEQRLLRFYKLCLPITRGTRVSVISGANPNFFQYEGTAECPAIGGGYDDAPYISEDAVT